jgi:hypothetical protein
MKYIILKNSKESAHFNTLAPWAVYDNDNGQLVAKFTTLAKAKAMVKQWAVYMGGMIG